MRSTTKTSNYCKAPLSKKRTIAAFFGEGPGVRIMAELEPEVADFASSRAEMISKEA